MMTLTLGRDVEYSRYQQWQKLREAQHQRLVKQALLHRKSRQEIANPGRISRQKHQPRLGRVILD